MTKILKFKIIILFSIFYFLFSIFPTSAASFFVNPQDLISGKETEVALNINTEDREINAVEMRLKFSPDDFLIKDITDGNSIINLWINKPKFSNEKGEIYFSGITPGGFHGASGQLLKIILSPQKTGEAGFEIAEAKSLLNDGVGTEAKLTLSNLKFNVAEVRLPTEVGLLPVNDADPPEDFKPEIASDPNIFSGRYFLAFATQDKGSGVDYYAIHENTRKKEATRIDTKDWTIAEGPYVLKDQKLRSYIYVKAVDKAGNERVAVVEPRYPVKWFEIWWIWGIIISGLIIGYILWKIIKLKIRSTK